MSTVTLEDIREAAERLEGAVQRTPFRHSETLSQITGAEVYVKFENRQFTASFKERGALNRLHALSDEERAKGVIAISAGNHAQGVAYHAQRLGVPATIVMPKNTPFVKVHHTRAFGADVVLVGETIAECRPEADKLAADGGLTFIHPFDDAAIIAGQGTIALEMLDEVPDLDVLVVPIGGGGLISGMATAAKALKPDIEVVGVEAAAYASTADALEGKTGEYGGPTVAEGIAVKQPGELTLPIIRELVSDVMRVDEAALEEAINLYFNVEKTVAEGAGAASLAALQADPDRFRGRKVGLVLCGGNIDSRVMAMVIMRGLVREGRIARFRIEIKDQPGALAEISGIIGGAGGNIVEVVHQRLFYDIPIKEVDVDVAVETRDAVHVKEIAEALVAAGYPTRVLGSKSTDSER